MMELKQTTPICRTADETGTCPPNLCYVYFLTAFVSIGAMLFGYAENNWVTGAVVSLYDIGCLVGAMSIGYLADRYGRGRMLTIASVVFVTGAVGQSASYNITAITLGRVILGYGVSTCAGSVPLYVSEIAPAKLRGRIIGIEQMILCLGELATFWLDYGFNYLETPGWCRIPLAIQVLPAILLGIEVLARHHGDDSANLQMAEIADEVAFEKAVATATWQDMFKRPVLRVTLLGMGVQFFQQIAGTNSILYYTRGGITDPKLANLATGGIGIVLFVSAWVPMFVFDRLGRKTRLQIGLVGMCCAMIGIAVPHWGVGSWTYATEISPAMYRAKGNALSTASLWLSCYTVAQAGPPIATAIGRGLYIIYPGICVFAFLFVRYAMVETKGKTLEEMSARSGMDVNSKRVVAEYDEVVRDA
ncbi:putative sugar transporter [Durotheca rogersii]|uniref:putative sugar transporter n=1 Tax=Durotheca rogersii TaxID=419775 RepID=UPI00221FD094|nr:putative sugar transporter [Durotheca rogersii]KAI5860943.1 putative sugar transporter [Durotheca rogersii]